MGLVVCMQRGAAVAVVGFGMVLCSCGGSNPPAGTSPASSTSSAAEAAGAVAQNPVPRDSHSVQLGKTLYARQCQSCHGARGKGDGPAAGRLNVEVTDLTDADVQLQTDGQLFTTITKGSKPMPAYRKLLTEEQRWHVVNYLRTAFGKNAG